LESDNDISRWLPALSVHFITAAGAFCGIMALVEIINGFLAPAFGWLGVALIIDGIDGTLARSLEVSRYVPRWNGAALDLVVDYLTYVVVPLMAVWQAGLLPEGLAAPMCGVLAAASALYFADGHMKTQDHWFRGFPSLWNVVALYLFCFPLPPLVNAFVLGVFGILMFAPIAIVHPLRVKDWRIPTLIATAAWVIGAAAVVLGGFRPNDWARGLLMVSAAWFLFMSVRRALRGPAA
jgi:phosphatidylcholine synthase